jgi:hypothetical protein
LHVDAARVGVERDRVLCDDVPDTGGLRVRRDDRHAEQLPIRRIKGQRQVFDRRLARQPEFDAFPVGWCQHESGCGVNALLNLRDALAERREH